MVYCKEQCFFFVSSHKNRQIFKNRLTSSPTLYVHTSSKGMQGEDAENNMFLDCVTKPWAAPISRGRSGELFFKNQNNDP